MQQPIHPSIHTCFIHTHTPTRGAHTPSSWLSPPLFAARTCPPPKQQAAHATCVDRSTLLSTHYSQVVDEQLLLVSERTSGERLESNEVFGRHGSGADDQPVQDLGQVGLRSVGGSVMRGEGGVHHNQLTTNSSRLTHAFTHTHTQTLVSSLETSPNPDFGFLKPIDLAADTKACSCGMLLSRRIYAFKGLQLWRRMFNGHE